MWRIEWCNHKMLRKSHISKFLAKVSDDKLIIPPRQSSPSVPFLDFRPSLSWPPTLLWPSPPHPFWPPFSFRTDYLINLFHKCDMDKDGLLSPAELANLFSVSGVCVSVCLSVSVCQSVCLSVCLSVYLPTVSIWVLTLNGLYFV